MSLKDHQIPLAEAAAMTAAYRTFPIGQLGQLLGGVKGASFSVEALAAVMQQPGCVSVRFYFAIEGLLPPKITFVAVGVDANGNDITTGIVLDRASICPPVCSELNVLNS